MPTDAQYLAEETYNRARYDLIRRNQATLKAINELATDEALTVLDAGLDLSRYEYAGYMRQVLPPILDKWGNVSAKAALDHYEAARMEWTKVVETRTIKNTWDVPHAQVVNGAVTVLSPGEIKTVTQPRFEAGLRGTGTRQRTYAAKVTQGRIYQATIPPFDPDAMSDPVIAQAMKAYSAGGVKAGNNAAANALTRQIGAYNRDTSLYNAGLDRSVAGVQRVVNPNGCAWCKTLAVGGMGRRGARVMDYAVHFHDHCRCHIETLFAGDKPLRPDYYDDIEKDLDKVRSGDYDEKGQRALRDGASTNETLRGQVQALRSVERSKNLPVLKTIEAPPVVNVPTVNDLLSTHKDLRPNVAREIYEGKDFNGFTLKVDSVKSNNTASTIRMNIVSPEGGLVGHTERTFKAEKDGLTVHHDLLDIYKAQRGRGFSTAFSKFSEDWYKQSGVSSIEIEAALSDGAYTWAKAGYSWDVRRPVGVIRSIKQRISNLRLEDITEAQVTDLTTRLTNLVERLETEDWQSPGYVTPLEIANMDGPDIQGVSFGRWLLYDSYWNGVKKL